MGEKTYEKVLHIAEAGKYTDNYKAVIFDLDDTLYSEKEYVWSGYREIGRYLTMVEDCEKKLWEAFEKKEQAVDSVLQREGIYCEEIKAECLERYRRQNPNLHFYPGIKELLAELRQKGKKLGVLTDGRPEGQRKKIKSLQLERYVDAIVITDELGGALYRKPCEAGFLEICRRLDVPTSSAVYIGDNLQKDWNGARKAGLDFIWFRNEDGLYV